MNPQAVQVVEALGGTAAVARLFDIAMPSVTGWRKRGVPRARMQYLRAVHAEALAGIDLAAATAKNTPTKEPANA